MKGILEAGNCFETLRAFGCCLCHWCCRWSVKIDCRSWVFTILCHDGVSNNLFSGHMNFSLPGTLTSFSPSSFGHHWLNKFGQTGSLHLLQPWYKFGKLTTRLQRLLSEHICSGHTNWDSLDHKRMNHPSLEQPNGACVHCSLVQTLRHHQHLEQELLPLQF